jgi:hypothetical protein
VDVEDERIRLALLIAWRVSQDSVHLEIIRTAPANGLLLSKLERRDVCIEVREALELAPGRSLKKELSGTIRLAGEQGYLTGT